MTDSAMKAPSRSFSVDAVQEALREAGLDGWLFYDFRGLDPIAGKILGLEPGRITTRRWFYMVPATGEPSKLLHTIEQGALNAVPGTSRTYLSWESLQEGLREILGGAKRVAMQYSPENAVPYISRVDAGTVELVRSLGVEVCTSADLVQRFDCVLSPSQLESHRRAAAVLRGLIDVVFSLVATETGADRSITEKDVLTFLEERLGAEGFIYDHPAIVGVNAHAADPHFEVPESGSAPIRRGDVLLVDVWARESHPGSIYADITWTAFVGEKVPAEVDSVFRVVRDARDAAVALASERFRSGKPVRGFELDQAARGVIEGAGFGDRFIHRTGHSLHEEVHGNGAHLDDLETHDTRTVLPGTLFTVEPGIYLPGRFGIRSEVDVYHTGEDAEVTGQPIQREIRPLLG